MPAKKASTPAPSTKAAQKPAAKAAAPEPKKKAPVPVTDKAPAKTAAKPAAKTTKTGKTKAEELDTVDADEPTKKKPGRPAKAAADKPAAKRGRKPKAAAKEESDLDDADLSDIEEDLVEEVVEEVADPAAPAEKVKPLRMKISKAKERALMKEFGLDETVLSEEEAKLRRERLKTLIKLGKTRGYLTHGEINDHLPDKLVEAETLEVVVSLLNDMGVAVYEQTPDAETLLLSNAGPTAATEEEAEEEAEAALSTVDSEFGRTTDPVRMYMREMGTVELLTREGEIAIAKRIEEGLNQVQSALASFPWAIQLLLEEYDQHVEGKKRLSEVVSGFIDPNAMNEEPAPPPPPVEAAADADLLSSPGRWADQRPALSLRHRGGRRRGGDREGGRQEVARADGADLRGAGRQALGCLSRQMSRGR